MAAPPGPGRLFTAEADILLHLGRTIAGWLSSGDEAELTSAATAAAVQQEAGGERPDTHGTPHPATDKVHNLALLITPQGLAALKGTQHKKRTELGLALAGAMRKELAGPLNCTYVTSLSGLHHQTFHKAPIAPPPGGPAAGRVVVGGSAKELDNGEVRARRARRAWHATPNTVRTAGETHTS